MKTTSRILLTITLLASFATCAAGYSAVHSPMFETVFSNTNTLGAPPSSEDFNGAAGNSLHMQHKAHHRKAGH